MFDHIQAFYQPNSIREAVRLLRRGGRQARVVAGGTDLVVERDRSIRLLVDVTRLGLDYIRQDRNGLVVGATATMASLAYSPKIRALADGILATAASTCGSVQVRNMATVGGNLASASPAADTATPLLVLEATVVLAGPRGRSRVLLEKFFTGPRKTLLNGALLVEIAIPPLPRGLRTAWSYQKLGRNQTDIAVVNVAAGLCLDRAGRCVWARIALGAVGPTPMRAHKAEALLAGQMLTQELVDRVGDAVMQQVRPIDDLRASAEYRREMSRVLVRRALADCAERAGCSL
jgi:probable selenate reductase FAD-binding subunit